MFNRKIISILLAVLIMASFAGCGGGSQTTVTSNAGGPTGSATGSASLAWNAPTTNVDGTPIAGLAGFRIYYGTVPGAYAHVVDVGSVTSYAINNLAVGTYYFSVTAYDSAGSESAFSNEVSKTVL